MAAPPTGIDPATATPDQLKTAAKKHFADHLNDIAELERVAPTKVRADVALYARVARHIAVTGQIDEFDTPENAPAINRHEAFNKSACDRALKEEPGLTGPPDNSRQRRQQMLRSGTVMFSTAVSSHPTRLVGTVRQTTAPTTATVPNPKAIATELARAAASAWSKAVPTDDPPMAITTAAATSPPPSARASRSASRSRGWGECPRSASVP